MIYRTGTVKLNLPESGPGRKRRTPCQVVPWRDVAESSRCLDAICSTITAEGPLTVVDGIAKVGFWGAVFRNHWPDCHLHLNETDEGCLEVLRLNFPKDLITNRDIAKWAPKAGTDVGLLDGDHFTLRRLDEWKLPLKKWAKRCTRLIVADGACYGFKFGNLKHYEVDTEFEYYILLDRALRKMTGKGITTLCRFENAATLLLEEKESDHIEIVMPSSLAMFRGGKRSPFKPLTTEGKADLWSGI